MNKPVEVCLVLMPYASLERPSIALSILKASLHNHGISSSVIYGNMLFADKIGAHIYDVINKSQSHSLAGEWTFSKTLFPDFDSDMEAYFEHTKYALDCIQPFITYLGSHLDIRDVLKKIRTITDAFIEEMAQSILALKPKIVGCSSTFQQHCASLALLKKIKELDPSVVTMLGGANCEASMGIVTHRECEWVDYVVSGEADLILPKLSKAILEGRQLGLKELPSGAIGPPHRDEMQYMMLELRPPRAKLKNMADSPAPDYEDYFEFIKYSSCGKYIKPGLLAETSRGCWWGAISHCTFCGLNGESMAHRSKDQQRVLEELNDMSSKYGLYSIEVVDNILDMNYFQHLIPQLAEQEVEYDIFYETKSNLSKKKLAELSDAGIRWLQPGIESLDDTILKMIGKGTSSKINLQLMKWAQEKGIFVLWIMLYDLPGEEDELYAKMAEWLPYISHFQPPSGLSFIQINRFSPYQMRPEEYDIELSADRAYSYVYPWSQESIDQFAYFFDDYSKERARVGFNETKTSFRPGINAIQTVMNDWQRDWTNRRGNHTDPESQQFNLVYEDKNGVLTVYDTRSCALQERYRLEGLKREIYIACDQFRSQTGVRRALKEQFSREATLEEIEPVLDEFVTARIILKLEDQYFSLAIQYPLYRPMPLRHNYPGGRLYSKLEIESMEYIRLAQQALL